MLISCPACAARYRLDPARLVGKRLSIRCPACQNIFVIPQRGPTHDSGTAVLLATGNASMAKALVEQCRQNQMRYEHCSDGAKTIRVLTDRLPTTLLLDVALTGRYAHEVIAFVRNQPRGAEVKILLLTSSFRRGSFIARTMDLHGADATCDGEVLAAMAPEEFGRFLSHPGSWRHLEPEGPGGESSDPDPVVWNQATNLAKVIAADIVLRHQDLLEESSRSGVLSKALVEGLAKARQLFSARMGEDFAKNYDFVGAALAACLQGRCSEEDRDTDEEG